MPSYLSIIREKTFLDVSNRAMRVGRGQIMSIAQSDNIITFQVAGLTDTYNEYVHIEALDDINTFNYTYSQLVDIITKSSLEVACTCPAFLYWGHQYVSAVKNWGLWIAGIAPEIRDPNLKGGACKHLYRIMTEWPEFATYIATLYPYKLETVIPISGSDRKNRFDKINGMFKRINLKYGSGSR